MVCRLLSPPDLSCRSARDGRKSSVLRTPALRPFLDNREEWQYDSRFLQLLSLRCSLQRYTLDGMSVPCRAQVPGKVLWPPSQRFCCQHKNAHVN